LRGRGHVSKKRTICGCAHIMAALGFRHGGEQLPSATLAESVNANPTFVRKSLSKLSKAGLIATTRGKDGASRLTRSLSK
jgi:DNA-binding IscR family transcriptional regulator